MNLLYGETRTFIGARHALVAPDGRVPATLPGVKDGMVTTLISPALGAGFAQFIIDFQSSGSFEAPTGPVERFGYVLTGLVEIEAGQERANLSQGGYFFAPAGTPLNVAAAEDGTSVHFFSKHYVPLDGCAAPEVLIGAEQKVESQPFLGDELARLQILLPSEPALDMAVNIFNYAPGSHLPFVETHVMEHGLLMLQGKGIYRLENAWYPVRAGDCIWMAPYCPQWFAVIGTEGARYLYYKDINRSAELSLR